MVTTGVIPLGWYRNKTCIRQIYSVVDRDKMRVEAVETGVMSGTETGCKQRNAIDDFFHG